MSNRLQHIVFILLAIFFTPQVMEGQYYHESLKKYVHKLQDTKLPNSSDINELRKARLIIIKAEKSKNKYSFKSDKENRLNMFYEDYNRLIDSFAKKHYPFSSQIYFLTEKEAKKKFKKRKAGESYAYMKVMHGKWMYFGIYGDRRAIHAVPIPCDEHEAPEMTEANILFIFQRLEKFLERREKGGRLNPNLRKKIRAELKDRLDGELESKRLLIDNQYIQSSKLEKDIWKSYPYRYSVLTKEEIDKAILDKKEGYYYVKIIPYQPSVYLGQDIVGHKIPSHIPPKSSIHYIIDPIDGSAVFVNFYMGNAIASGTLEKYVAELRDPYMSVKYLK